MRDYIRHRSERLNNSFAATGPTTVGRTQMAEMPVTLGPDLLAAVSKIIGKSYTAGTLVRHRFYETWGYSVRFRTADGQYSEANAGSGETAVVMMARMFQEAKPGSLLLLDEPETSLHPGAQAELLRFMLGQIKTKKLQVVISTHAPAFVRHLPKSAIKVLQGTPDGFVRVVENVSPEEAFHEIGQEFDATCNIVVEDKLAKAILDAVAKTQGDAYAKRVQVRYGPGGDSAMKQDAAVFTKTPTRAPVLIFDGDKEKSHQDVEKLTQAQMTPECLDRLIEQQVGEPIRFAQNSNMALTDKVQLRVTYLKYFHRKVFYLPFDSPEKVLWSDEVAKSQLELFLAAGKAGPVVDEISRIADSKKKFAKLAAELGGPDLHPAALHAMFVKRFVDQNALMRDKLISLLNQALAAVEQADA